MSERQALSLKQARQQTPAQALGDWTLSLREAAYDAISEEDITAIMKAQVEKAKGGDAKAAQFVLDYFTKLPTTTISMGRAAADRAAEGQPRVVVPPSLAARVKPSANGKHEPSDEELDRQIIDEQTRHPLWKPSPFRTSDPRHNEVVKLRVEAGLPPNHPDDAQPNLD